jgi:hypothetical protein
MPDQLSATRTKGDPTREQRMKVQEKTRVKAPQAKAQEKTQMKAQEKI